MTHRDPLRERMAEVDRKAVRVGPMGVVVGKASSQVVTGEARDTGAQKE